MQLVHAGLRSVPALVDVPEDLLRDLGLPLRGCSPELVEADAEPLVDLSVQGVVLITDLLRSEPFLDSLRLGRGSVLVSAANKDHIVAAETCKPGVDVRREHTADNVAEVGDVVHVGEGGGDHDVPFAVLG